MNYRKRVGEILILVSVGILIFTYYPTLFAYFPNDAEIKSSNNGQYLIRIPKINASAPIIEDVNPWVEEDYKKALKRGVAHAKGFAKPGDKTGIAYLFAHSSLPPWEMTRSNTSFLRLGELSARDEIIITRNAEKYVYLVRSSKEVWPNQVDSLFQGLDADLILQTCTPLGTSLKRLLIFASLKN